MSEGEQQSFVLPYGHTPRQFIGPRRLAMTFVAMLIVLLVAPRIQNWIHGQWAVHRAIAHCMGYATVKGRVVYEEDATLAKTLAHGQTTGPDWSTTTSAGRIVGYSAIPPLSMNRLNGWAGPNIFPYSPNLVFLHSVRSVSGQDRLVYVAVNGTFSLRQGNGNKLTPGAREESNALDWLVVDPGSVTQASKLLNRDSFGDGDLWIRMPWPIRIFAGQPDATDPTKFTITYRTPTGPATLVGQLGADDRLTFSRTPAKP